MYSSLEQLLLKGCKGECYDEQMAIVSERYADDINTPNLKIQQPCLLIWTLTVMCLWAL